MSASNEETLHPIDRWARAVCETAAPQDRAGRSLEDAARLQLFGPAMNAITQQDPEGRHLEDQAFAGLFGGPAPAPPAPQRIGKYVLGGPLGSGGMGDVFLALHTELHRKVAIKLLRVHKQRDPVERSRLLREAQALAQLDHNNVVQVYDSGLHEDRVYLVMKYVEGCTLRAWQDAAHRSWREVVQHYVAAGRGLAAIHAAGLVHRDFKPQNVLVSALDKDRPTDRASVAERVKITDFGLAVTPGERTAGTTVADAQGQTPGLLAMQLTASASVLGTPLYVSPEQLGAQPLDARSDQFSFCVALYEALYGEHPYAEPDTASDSRAPTDNQTRAAVGTRPSATPSMASLVTGLVQGPLRRPKKIVIPGRIYRAIERGLSREPAGRYPTMAELLAALERDPVRKYGTLVGMAGLGALVVGAAVAPQLLSKCNDIAADFKDAWTPRRAADVERAFLATDSPHAALAAARVKQTLDAYSEQWLQLRAENCDTGRDRGTQTLEVTGRRDTCLDHARDTLAATVEQLTHADATTVETVQDALALLPALEQCDAKFQRQQTCLDEADDPQLRHRLDEARALEIAGKYVDAGEVATTVLADAGAHPRLMAESQLLRGRVLAEQDRSIEADAAFAAAYGLSEGAGCDTLAFEAATRRTKLIALNHDLPAETGLAWSEVARSKLGALPPSPRLEADLHSDLGLLLQQREDLGGSREEHLARAREEHGRALELRKQLAGDRETPELAFSYLNLGALEVSQGRHELAVEDLQSSLDLYGRIYGPEHPALWKPHRNLGSALLLAGDLPAARRHLERAIELVGASLGPSHAATGPLQYALAASYADSDSDSESDRKKDLDHAFKLATIALQTHIREVPDNNPRRVQPVILMGLLHTDRDEPAEALPYREEVLRRLRHAGPEDRADAHYNIAVTLHELHRSEEALDHIRLASALVSEFSTPSAELVEDIEAYKAEILRSLGRTQ